MNMYIYISYNNKFEKLKQRRQFFNLQYELKF